MGLLLAVCSTGRLTPSAGCSPLQAIADCDPAPLLEAAGPERAVWLTQALSRPAAAPAALADFVVGVTAQGLPLDPAFYGCMQQYRQACMLGRGLDAPLPLPTALQDPTPLLRWPCCRARPQAKCWRRCSRRACRRGLEWSCWKRRWAGGEWGARLRCAALRCRSAAMCCPATARLHRAFVLAL